MEGLQASVDSDGQQELHGEGRLQQVPEEEGYEVVLSSDQVVEVVNADALVVKTSDGQHKKIFFASLRSPRQPKEDNNDQAVVSGGVIV